jgi:deazaflavin-dependent oxidoreductase (nitroreductase family)
MTYQDTSTQNPESPQIAEMESGRFVPIRKNRSRTMPGDGLINRLGASRIGVWAIKHFVSPFQRWIYRATGGRVLSNLGTKRNVLLLTTKGRRTGKKRTTPVFYLQDGENVVICNVKPPFERTNPWVINLRSHPVVQAQIGSEVRQYQAREASEEELKRFWPQLIELWPAFQSHYKRGGHRSIFILERPDIEKKSFSACEGK